MSNILKIDTIEGKKSDTVTIRQRLKTKRISADFFEIGSLAFPTSYTTTNIADFSKDTVVWMENPPVPTDKIILKSIGTPNAMRIVYLIVKSNGVYQFDLTSQQGGPVLFPSNIDPVPSSANKYDIYSFLTNGKSFFATYAFNYDTFID